SLSFFFTAPDPSDTYTLSLHDALPISATIGRSAMLRAAELLADDGISVLDAPVSGGKGGAHGGTLTLMVSGPKSVLDANRHVLKDRKSTRLNSSHDQISYAVFCLKKKK